MLVLENRWANVKVAAAIALGSLSLSACATREYVDEQIAIVNGRVTQVDSKAADALQRAEAANAAATAAAADARNANQRLDQLTPRVDTLEQSRMSRQPRN